jgi:hypothetical protein
VTRGSSPLESPDFPVPRTEEPDLTEEDDDLRGAKLLSRPTAGSGSALSTALPSREGRDPYGDTTRWLNELDE